MAVNGGYSPPYLGHVSQRFWRTLRRKHLQLPAAYWEREREFSSDKIDSLCSYYPAGSRALTSLTPTDFCRNTVYACSKHRSLHASSKEAQLIGSHKTYGLCFTCFPFTFPFRFVYEMLQRAHLLWTPTVTSFYGGVACINHALCIASDLLLVRSILPPRARTRGQPAHAPKLLPTKEAGLRLHPRTTTPEDGE